LKTYPEEQVEHSVALTQSPHLDGQDWHEPDWALNLPVPQLLASIHWLLLKVNPVGQAVQ